MAMSGGGTPAPNRKTTAKRGPTKAAALKTLGLTQEDLDAIKELKEFRELHEKTVAQQESKQEQLAAETGAPPKAVEEHGMGALDPRTEEQQLRDEIARLRAEREDGQSSLSEDRQLMNLGWSAAAPQADTRPDPTTGEAHAPVFYARNLRGVEVRFRLTRQNVQGSKPTLLKPRGSRGDMFRLEAGDLQDAELRTQVAYQLIEIIPEGEALNSINKQAINASEPGARAIHQMLTNEKGDKMLTETNTEVVKTDALPFEQQGVTVARLNPQENSPTGELPSRGKGIDWAAARNVDPVQKGVGQGPIIHDGYADETAALAARDAAARAKNLDGPKAGGLGGMKVTVAETEKS